MRHLRSKAPLRAAVAALALFAGSAATADIVPLFSMVQPNGPNCTFSYNVFVSAGSKVDPAKGDFFTIYDFNGYVAGSAFAPVDWDIDVQPVGVTPAGQLIVENPTTVNITFTYVGSAVIPEGGPIGGPDAFGADSVFCNATSSGGQYASQTHKDNPGQPDDNTFQSNQGFVVTPAVPETSSLALLLPGLLPLGIIARRRMSKK
jgi:hypothetical protein